MWPETVVELLRLPQPDKAIAPMEKASAKVIMPTKFNNLAIATLVLGTNGLRAISRSQSRVNCGVDVIGNHFNPAISPNKIHHSRVKARKRKIVECDSLLARRRHDWPIGVIVVQLVITDGVKIGVGWNIPRDIFCGARV